MHGILPQLKRSIFTSSSVISANRYSTVYSAYNKKFRIKWEQSVSMGTEAMETKTKPERSSTSSTFDSDEMLGIQDSEFLGKSMFSLDKALPFEQIPGPGIFKLWEKYWKYVPLIGRLNWNRNITPLRYFFTKYGAVVRINGPFSSNVIMIQRPDHIAQVLEQEGDTPIRSGIDILDHYRLHHRKYRLTGPFSMESADWLRLREKFNESFGQIISNHFNQITLISNDVCNQIRTIRNKQDEVPLNFHDILLRWELECFCLLMLNRNMGFLEPNSFNPISELSKTIEALNTAHKYMNICESGFQVWRFFDTPFSKKFFTACDILDELITKCMVQIQCELNSQSLYLLGDFRANDDDAPPILGKLLLNQNLHLDDVSTILLDMMIMGVQAVTNTVAFLLYFVARNPRIQRTLYNEIISVSGRNSVTDADLKSMKYLKACLQECLRLRPAFPYMTRVLPKTITLHGYTVPAGTHVIMASELAARKEENFENPDKFDPSRWLADETIDNPLQEFSCLSFGYGLRSCIGKTMAETQIMMLIAQLIREFRIEYDYADIGSRFMMVNVPNKPLRFRFVDRQS